MADHSETRSEHVLLPMEATVQPKRATYHCTWTTLLVVAVFALTIVLVIVFSLTFHNPGTRNETNQVHPPTASENDPSATPSLTNNCDVHEKMETFSGSEKYCRSRNYRLLTEQDTKTAADCITRGEDFWAAPVKRNPGDCFIYNTDHGFVQMDCLTLRWFICLEN